MKDVVKALRWLAKETEFDFAAEQMNEAAALIESLQGKIIGKDALIATNKALMNAAISENGRLQGELTASQRRERAAVEDIVEAHDRGRCAVCKHKRSDGGACKKWPNRSCFEWRGVQAGEVEQDG